MIEDAAHGARGELVAGFEAQAKRTPDAIAIEDGSQRISYQDLNDRANGLAHVLIEAGADSEFRAGLYIESGANLIVAMLAVWKAGAAFVPFDVNQPPNRLAVLCEEAGPQLFLTRAGLQSRLIHLDIPLIAVDEIIADPCLINPPIVVPVRSLAYLIPTSGSTGSPKAVAVEHCALVNLVRWANEAVRPVGADRSAQIVAVAFDPIALEIWPYLLVGGTICHPGRLDRQSPEQLQRWLLHHRITVLIAPTPLGEALLALNWPADCSVRLMIVGGDRLRRYPDPSHPFQLMNAYGPTENTVVSTYMIVPSTPGTTLPSIGRPIPGQSAAILDENLTPVPAGSIGELYLIGNGLARGYHGDPVTTAARFLPCPFGPVPGARMFRSGDFARCLPNGNIEFVGRRDRQVKILGYRVDLAEIEVCLLNHSCVTDVAVITDELSDGRTTITAYVVAENYSLTESDTDGSYSLSLHAALPSGDSGPSEGDVGGAAPDQPYARRADPKKLIDSLRAFAPTRLPAYMCPSAYCIIPVLPLTDNGKIDVRALRDACFEKSNNNDLSQAEQQLAQIFCGLLGVSTVGPDDDFFLYGGHSLLTAQLVQEIWRDFGVNVAIDEVYRHPRLQELANLVTARRAIQCRRSAVLPDCVVPILNSDSSLPFFCVAPGGGSPMCYRKLANHLDADQCVFGLESQGLRGHLKPLTNIEGIAATYIAAIRQVQPCGPYRIGGWSFGAIVAWEMATQLADRGQEVDLLALIDGWAEPPGRPSRGAWLLETGAIAQMCFRFVRQIKLPRSYDGLRELAQWIGIALPDTLTYLKHATWRERARTGLRITREANRSLRVFKANARAAVRYRPRPYKGSCVLYRAGMNGTNGRPDRVAREVRELAAGTVEVVCLDGSHMSLMMNEEHITRLAAALGLQLRQTRANVGGAENV